jgi:GPI mannosyltransferase 3
VWNGRKKWSAFLILTSWFWFYTGSRTLSNTVETALTTIALSYFPWRKGNESSTFLWFVAIATFLRPTAAIPWIPLFFYHIEKSKFTVFELLFKRYLLIGLLIGGIGMAIDTQMYGKMIITPWEFVKLNVLEGVGSTYGTHPWYWYFSVGLPTVLGIGTLTFVLAMVEVLRHRKLHEYQTILLISIVCTLCVYSLIPHKEFRFVLQLLPFCLYISTDFLAKWSRNASQ